MFKKLTDSRLLKILLLAVFCISSGLFIVIKIAIANPTDLSNKKKKSISTYNDSEKKAPIFLYSKREPLKRLPEPLSLIPFVSNTKISMMNYLTTNPPPIPKNIHLKEFPLDAGKIDDPSKIQQSIKIPLLVYHHIDTNAANLNKYIAITPEEMESHLRYFNENGYTTISLYDLYKYIGTDNYQIPEKPILFTFDDGYQSNYQYLFPLLKKYKMRSTLFAVTRAIGRGGSFPCYTWDEAREMEESNLVEIYSHSSTHANFTRLSPGSIMDNINEAQSAIDFNLGLRRIKAFAYPFGAYNSDSQYNVKYDLKYDMQLTTKDGVNTKNSDLSEIKRITVLHGQKASEIEQHIQKFEKDLDAPVRIHEPVEEDEY